jgi:flagellar hook-associated protein 2
MSDSLFQISGVSSGIAWDEIINKIVDVGKKPATQWQTQIDTLEVKKTLYQELQSEFNKLRNTLTKLRLANSYKSKKAEYTGYSANNADPQSIISAKINNNAELTWWDIDVKELARGQRHMSSRFDNMSEVLGVSGSFRIRVGKQYANIEVKSTDTIRDINYSISKAVDQNGKPIAVTAKILDNRIVIESANTGKGNSGDTRGVDFTMTDAVDYYLPHASARDTATGKYIYPPQILELYYEDANVDGTMYRYEYKEGIDFDYIQDTGKIEWKENGARPPKGATFNAIYSEWVPVFRNNSAGLNMDYLPDLFTGAPYDSDVIFVIVADGTEYEHGVDFNIGTDFSGKTYIDWNMGVIPLSNYAVRLGANSGYSYDENVFYMEPTDGVDYGANSVLAKLGFITPGLSNDEWEFTAGSYRNASDAVFEIDGVEVTRSTNTIDDIIANVTLELKGLGQVRMNVVHDLTETTENIQTFVDSYNAVMEWINYYVSQKQDAANRVDETDHLSSILRESKGNTVFGVLHGDQLLWSIKNQLRSRISNPIATLSGSLMSRKVVNPASAMNIRGSFHVYAGGKASRIDIIPGDTLEDIQKKLQDAQDIFSLDGQNTFTSNGNLGLNVVIRDGQLVIEGSKSTTPNPASGNMDVVSTTTFRSKTNAYDYLPYIPVTSSPVNGALKISLGPTVYEEGTDYRIVTQTSAQGVMSSRIEWMSGKSPLPGQSYNVEYTYFANAVSFVPIDGTGPIGSEHGQGISDLSFLDLHQSSSKLALMTLGITTESNDYGKSGYIEFDSEKFLAQMESDPEISGNAMLTFMREMDVYIGNLVDSSQTLVAGQIVTKGRIAGALNSIDSEQSTLNDRITKLERQLEERQTSLYKQYSDMEVAIQKLNAQMSSLTNYLSNMSGNK